MEHLWDKTSHDFGTVGEGQTLSTSFSYTGEGYIINAYASCGCTIPSFSKNTVNVKLKTGKIHEALGQGVKSINKYIIVKVRLNNEATTIPYRLDITAEVHKQRGDKRGHSSQ